MRRSFIGQVLYDNEVWPLKKKETSDGSWMPTGVSQTASQHPR